jgi:hypothetical protein
MSTAHAALLLGAFGADFQAESLINATNVFKINTPGCNSGSIHQIPGHGDFFIGRLPISKTGTKRDPPPGNFGCMMDGWQLGLLQMHDWSSLSLNVVQTVLWPNAHDSSFPKTPIQNGKYVLDSAYDPTVALLDGELWVSFECAGTGFFTSSCIGPLVGSVGKWTLDLSRTTIAVTPPTANKAASVPKICSFKGASYLWYDYFRTDEGYIEARGVTLKKDSSGRMWAAGHLESMPMDDPSAVRVWKPAGSDSSIADVFMIEPIKGVGGTEHLLVFAGIGGAGCSSPGSNVSGCYRIAVGRTNFALGQDTANEVTLNQSLLPGNPMEYSKEMTRPSGQKLLYAHFLDPHASGDPGYPIPGGFEGLILQRDAAKPFFGLTSPCDQQSKPFPNWGDRGMECLASCGGIGGKSSFNTPCADNGGKADAGRAYDTPYCCK